MTMRVIFTADRSEAIMSEHPWRQRIPATAMPAQLAFYRRMRDRLGGRYAQFYEAEVATIERAMQRAGMEIGDQP